MTERFWGASILPLALLGFASPYGWTGESPCSPDPCINGFCRPDPSDGTSTCDCVLGYEGRHCTREIDQPCEPACGEHGVCELLEDVNNVGLVSAQCICDLGWSGLKCTEMILGYNACTQNQCNGHGVCEIKQWGMADCSCDEGWSGPSCDVRLHMCTYDYLLDLSTTVYAADHNAGFDCKYWIGLLWTEARGNAITSMPALCTCLSWIIENEPIWSQNLGCIIEEEFPLSLLTEYDMHCNNCSDKDILEMKGTLKNETHECRMFITHRDEMPLNWRTRTKCECLLSLGDRETAAALVTCPFTAHAARTDMVAYDNCKSPDVDICDFQSVKNRVREGLMAIYPAGWPICSQAFKVYFESTPDSNHFSSIVPTWCPCYEILATWWPKGLEVLNCNAVTFYEFTLAELFGMYCWNPVFQRRELLWSMYELIVPLTPYDQRLADICYSTVAYVGAYATMLGMSNNTGYVERSASMVCTCFYGITSLEESEYGAELLKLVDFRFEYAPLVDGFLGDSVGFYSSDCVPPTVVNAPTPAPVKHHSIDHNVKFTPAPTTSKRRAEDMPGSDPRVGRHRRRAKLRSRRREPWGQAVDEKHPYFFTPSPHTEAHHGHGGRRSKQHAYRVANVTLGILTGVLFTLNCYLHWQKVRTRRKRRIPEDDPVTEFGETTLR